MKKRYCVAILISLTLVLASLFACSNGNTQPSTSVPITIPPSPTITPGTSASPTPKAKVSPDDAPRISVVELKQKIDNGTKMLIVDVRSKEEFNIDHISGSISVPIGDITGGSWFPTPGKEIVLYCNWPNGKDSASAQGAALLINAGFQNVEVLKGGYDAWKLAGYPLVTQQQQ
jgi:rhodanese-related sulfurtransferase